MNFDIGATPEAKSQLKNRAQNIHAPIDHWGCQSSTKTGGTAGCELSRSRNADSRFQLVSGLLFFSLTPCQASDGLRLKFASQPPNFFEEIFIAKMGRLCGL
ncbi:MAG UNVERIFIED_CONTAM: hypothetical protein LVR18_32315 [Planctomycetaceae bacterium]|jgi:hypothetical protein